MNSFDYSVMESTGPLKSALLTKDLLKKTLLKTVAILSTVSILTACGGGDGGSNVGVGANRNGTVSIGVTDAPVTDAKKVLVAFKQVQIKHEDKAPETFDVTDDGSSLVVDLLTLQGAQQTTLVREERVTAGRYEWIRFIIDPEKTQILPDIEGSMELQPLTVPSGRIQLIGGFTVPADGVVNYIIDFDLRHSLVKTGAGVYKLKPVLRMTENSEIGHIAGYIDHNTYENCADINDEPNNVAVTLFAGDLDETEFDDADSDPEVMDVLDEADIPEPITAGIVASDPNLQNRHTFEIGFVTAGTYQLVLTCGTDDPLEDQNPLLPDSTDLRYEAFTTVIVEKGETTDVVDDDFEEID
ncbi:MAG: DUF4382 domain-containing protein [Ketobacteraceae bacterium]|nr:DUF4382 domain-containing protein [Ketobacteraceae bacterium]